MAGGLRTEYFQRMPRLGDRTWLILGKKRDLLVKDEGNGWFSIMSTSKPKRADLIKGGIADKSDYSKFRQDQLRKGIKVEMEHTNDPKIAKEIAGDHLKEYPKYYDALHKMEKKLDTKKKTGGKT